MEELEKMKSEFEEICHYARRVSLTRTLNSKKGLVYLSDLEKEILKLRNMRYSILQIFKSDIQTILLMYDKNASIQFDYKKLIEENFLKLQFSLMDEKINCLFSKDGLESTSLNSSCLEQILPRIYPCINGLFRIYEDSKTKNILSNELFDIENPLYAHIEQAIEKLLISGDGVTLPILEIDRLQLTMPEKSELIQYYYRNLERILRRLYVLNDTILEPYYLNATHGKVLSLYRGKK